MPLKIKELPETERPYEKLKMYGAKSLSNSELLAIIIKTGTKDETSVDIAKRVLLLTQSLKEIENLSINNLTKIKGIGEVKAIQIKAVCELAKRISKMNNTIKIQIKSPKDVANLLMDEMKDEKQEILKVLVLNSKNIVTKITDIVKGGSNFANVSIKQIITENIKAQEPKLIMVHNHPSGDPTPSNSDIKITKNVIKACEYFGIELVDHIVLSGENYVSILSMKEFKNKNL